MIRFAEQQDKEAWYALDRHLPETVFEEKVQNKQGYVCVEDGKIIGVLRYNLFWDNTPFCTMLFVDLDHRGQGYGIQLMQHWEQDMKSQGYGMLMTSTQVDEDAQHFYRKLGYKDCGGFVVDVPGYEQPMEMIMIKGLTEGMTTMEEKKDSIIIKSAETDEELCGRGYVHCTSWQEAYRGIVCDRYLDSMTVEATTARARQFPENTLIAKDKEKVVGFAVYGPSRDEDLKDAGEVVAIYVLSEYYDHKIGYRLMNEAFSRLSEYNTIFVWVLEKNERAISFYRKYGFEFDGSKKEWNLGTPVSIVRMIKKRE